MDKRKINIKHQYTPNRGNEVRLENNSTWPIKVLRKCLKEMLYQRFNLNLERNYCHWF